MIDDNDQFDQATDFEDGGTGNRRQGFMANMAEAWRTKPILKLIALVVGFAALVGLVIHLTASTPELENSRIGIAPEINEAPGGKASPAFIAAQAQANEQRIKEAAANGETALPTPLPSGINLDGRKETDPLIEFRAEMQRQKEEQQKQIAALQVTTQQVQQVTVQQDQQQQQAISQSLQAQLTKLAELWKPQDFKVVGGVEGAFGVEASKKETTTLASNTTTGNSAAGSAISDPRGGAASTSRDDRTKKIKPLVSAGTVNYAQMLTEANSDVPGPILAQILSGPLSGARAIGQFTVQNDLMTLTFKTAILKGREYKIDALALDPDTTLGGLATEVDQRYFTRIILPAAASFISAFGQKLSEKPATVTVTPNGTTITDQGRTGIKDGLYAGAGSAGETIAGFFADEAGRTKVLVRVAVGTPVGLFFNAPVCSGEYPCTATLDENGSETVATSLDSARPATGGAGMPAPPITAPAAQAAAR